MSCLLASTSLSFPCTLFACVCPVSLPSILYITPSDPLLVPTSCIPHLHTWIRQITPFSISFTLCYDSSPHSLSPSPSTSTSSFPPAPPRDSLSPPGFPPLSHHLLRHLSLGLCMSRSSPRFDDVLFGHSVEFRRCSFQRYADDSQLERRM